MGLQFTQDAWAHARTLTSPIFSSAQAFPMAASIHLTEIQFDELLVAVLLQACLGGSANMYRVQKINSYCFKFFVPSIATMNLILAQHSIKGRRFTLVFDHINLSPEPQTTLQIPPPTSVITVNGHHIDNATTPQAASPTSPSSTHAHGAHPQVSAPHSASDGEGGNNLRPSKPATLTMDANHGRNTTTPPASTNANDQHSSSSTSLPPPANEIWFGAHRVILDAPLSLPHRRDTQNQPIPTATRTDPIVLSSDDDSAPPSQRADATNNDPWAAATHFIIPPGVNTVDFLLSIPQQPTSPMDADAARGILLGVPVARPEAESSTAAAARVRGPDIDVHIPADLVQDTSSFAFAVIETPIIGPFEFIRMAVERRFPNVSFTFSASTYGSALMVFTTPAAREEIVNNSPIRFAGLHIDFLRPQDTEDRSTTTYSLLVELAASNYPLEMWHEAGAAFILGHVGQLCCVDRTCFDGSDRSSMRGFISIEPTASIPPALIIRLPNNDVVTVRLRIIQTWVVGLGNPFQPNDGANGFPPSSPAVPRHPPFGVVSRGTQTMDDIDENSIHADDQVVPETPAPANSPTFEAASSLATLQAQADLAHSAAVSAANAVVADAEDLLSSIRDMAIVGPNFEFGSTSSQPPQASAPPSPLLHENEARKRCVRAKRAADSAMKLRRSHWLTAKEEDNYIDMVSKAIKAKAASFDMPSATPALSRALDNSGLSARPGMPCDDVAALVAVALACGADETDVTAITDDNNADAADPQGAAPANDDDDGEVATISSPSSALKPGFGHDVCRTSCSLRHVPAAHRSGSYPAPPFISQSLSSMHTRFVEHPWFKRPKQM
ncbi:hypothetical protein ACQ4PT_066358 [Festuca glaucescens]